ncbi:unnamed protein product [Angiostrongylus costaricensis]|uniref:Transposase n=1 Tax=Angiostrongylus costaricensis TaxID=334426 RepID=A0A0R3PBJ9_ANGCS|nr:unnamed protein product [Angiostrongylus costaricensis]
MLNEAECMAHPSRIGQRRQLYPYPLSHKLYFRFLNSTVTATRNNAEMINHILKHYGTLNQLGDVGK